MGAGIRAEDVMEEDEQLLLHATEATIVGHVVAGPWNFSAEVFVTDGAIIVARWPFQQERSEVPPGKPAVEIYAIYDGAKDYVLTYLQKDLSVDDEFQAAVAEYHRMAETWGILEKWKASAEPGSPKGMELKQLGQRFRDLKTRRTTDLYMVTQMEVERGLISDKAKGLHFELTDLPIVPAVHPPSKSLPVYGPNFSQVRHAQPDGMLPHSTWKITFHKLAPESSKLDEASIEKILLDASRRATEVEDLLPELSQMVDQAWDEKRRAGVPAPTAPFARPGA
jgi:hypothetical protein